MQKQAYRTIAMMVLFGCLAVSAKAQCDGLPTTSNIPFKFSVGKTTLAAGEYKVDCLEPNGRVVLIQNTDGKGSATMLMVKVRATTQDGWKLVFHRYGSRYFFYQAFAFGSAGLELPTSWAERTLAAEVAGIKPKRETIALTAR